MYYEYFFCQKRTHIRVSAVNKKDKLLEPDILRTLAFAGVVAQHILGAYSRRANISLFAMKALSVGFEFTRFAVPVFVFLFSAMLFYQHFDELSYISYL